VCVEGGGEIVDECQNQMRWHTEETRLPLKSANCMTKMVCVHGLAAPLH